MQRERAKWLPRYSNQLIVVSVIVLICCELVSTAWATRQLAQLSLIDDLEDVHEDGLGHDLDTFVVPPVSNFGPFHHSPGLDTIALVDHHLHSGHSQGGCEPIKIGMCMELGYNETTMPNLVGHDAQADADALLQTFTPLIQYGCSPHLKLFLCSSHAPMCTDKTPQPIGPCRSLCESVRQKCEPVLTEFGFKWPPSLECSKFHPENNHQHMCIPGPIGSSHDTNHRVGFKDRVSPTLLVDTPVLRKHPDDTMVMVPPIGNVPVTRLSFEDGMRICQGPGRVWAKGSCWKKCPKGPSSTEAKPTEMDFARNYTLPWAILSLVGAGMALVLGFRSSKLTVAERPILYVAFCQVLFALGVIIGTTTEISCFSEKTSGLELLAGKGSVPSACALTFILTYFFGLATNLWWLILCLSWFLSLSMNVRIWFQQKERSWSHLVAWAIPAILSATALIYKKVDADELSGLCGIGFQESEALKFFVLVPLGTALILGSGALLLGGISRICPNCLPLICCFRKSKPNPEGSARHNQAYSPVLVLPPPSRPHNRNACHHQRSVHDQEDTSPSFFNSQPINRFQRARTSDKDQKSSWVRIGIFSWVHIVPLASQVGGLLYEYNAKEFWETGHGRPNLQILLLRLNMSLIPGLTAGVWVLSTVSWKTVATMWSSRWRWVFGKGDSETKQPSSPDSSGSTQIKPEVPLLAPAPVNSLATTYVSLGGMTDVTALRHQCQTSKPFAGIVRPRYHQPPLPPLPARNPDPVMLEAWRRTETIV